MQPTQKTLKTIAAILIVAIVAIHNCPHIIPLMFKAIQTNGETAWIALEAFTSTAMTAVMIYTIYAQSPTKVIQEEHRMQDFKEKRKRLQETMEKCKIYLGEKSFYLLYIANIYGTAYICNYIKDYLNNSPYIKGREWDNDNIIGFFALTIEDDIIKNKINDRNMETNHPGLKRRYEKVADDYLRDLIFCIHSIFSNRIAALLNESLHKHKKTGISFAEIYNTANRKVQNTDKNVNDHRRYGENVICILQELDCIANNASKPEDLEEEVVYNRVLAVSTAENRAKSQSGSDKKINNKVCKLLGFFGGARRLLRRFVCATCNWL